MSRHQLVKNLDLHDELDDFDGGDDYADEEEEGAEGTFGCLIACLRSLIPPFADPPFRTELSEEVREQMRLGMLAVRDTLGEDFDVSDKEVKDALWHYYYDVEKSVEYLLTTRMPKQKKKKKAKGTFISFGFVAFSALGPDLHAPGLACGMRGL
jgi:elongation factor 1 alpha-like protein